MRPKVIAAVVGLTLTVGGVGGLAYGITRMSATPGNGDCAGDECLADPSIIAFPVGLVAMIFGLIIASWALGSLRSERDSTSPLRAFGFMSGLGGVFAAMGIIFVANSRGADDDGSLLFVGALFGVMGLCFIGVDLLRFRGELKKDRLRVSGLHGTAKVLDVRDTNVTVNNSPMVNFDLEVTVPGQQPFRAHKRVVISRLSVGALSPGAIIPVLADARNPKDIVLDWEAGTTAPSTGSSGDLGRGSARWPRLGYAALLGGASGAPNAEVLRSVSQALERAAERAEQGGGGVTQTADGTTTIDGGTSVVVNGRQVPASDVGATLAGLPGILAAAFGTSGTSMAGSSGAAEANAAAPSGLAGSSGAAGVPGPAGPSTTDGIDIPMPGATPAADSLPARVNLDTIQDTGVDIAGNRLYAFDLTVSIAGRSPYQMKHAAAVPNAQVVRLVQGASFPAHVDPSQPGQISIAWDR